MRELVLIVTAIIIIALVAVVFVVLYINHNKNHGKSHKPAIIYYKAKDKEENDANTENSAND